MGVQTVFLSIFRLCCSRRNQSLLYFGCKKTEILTVSHLKHHSNFRMVFIRIKYSVFILQLVTLQSLSAFLNALPLVGRLVKLLHHLCARFIFHAMLFQEQPNFSRKRNFIYNTCHFLLGEFVGWYWLQLCCWYEHIIYYKQC